jgi:hypothetical protein
MRHSLVRAVCVLASLLATVGLYASFHLVAADNSVVVPVIIEKVIPLDLVPREKKAAAATNGLTSRKVCNARGGVWIRMGLLGNFGCNLPTKDAGKACTDDDQCEMYCQPPEEMRQSFHPIGSCSATYAIFGCQGGMKDGWVMQGKACVD